MGNRPLRIDWQRIKSVYPDDYYVVALMSKRASSCLLSLMHILEYDATFKTSDYDFADWDELQHILSEADREIGAAMPLSELVGYIDEVEELLRALQYTANCCDDNTDITDGDWYTNPVVDGEGNVPQEIIDAGYATGTSDWSGFDDYKCMISYLVVDDLEAKLRTFAPYVDSAGVIIGGIATIASILTTIFTGGLGAIALGIIATTGTTALFYKLVTDGSVLEGIADEIATNREDLACAVYGADGSAAAHTALNAKIDELFSVIEAPIIKAMNLGPTLKALYGGLHDTTSIAQKLEDLGYVSGDFDCACLPPAVPQAGCLTGLLYNCGFESALGSEWELVSGPAIIRKSGANAHDGTYGLGSATSEQTIWFKQEFISDGNYTRIDVQFWHRASSGLIIKVNGGQVYNNNFLQADAQWRFIDTGVTTTVDVGDLVEIRPRLHSTYSVDSFNVVMS